MFLIKLPSISNNYKFIISSNFLLQSFTSFIITAAGRVGSYKNNYPNTVSYKKKIYKNSTSMLGFGSVDGNLMHFPRIQKWC